MYKWFSVWQTYFLEKFEKSEDFLKDDDATVINGLEVSHHFARPRVAESSEASALLAVASCEFDDHVKISMIYHLSRAMAKMYIICNGNGCVLYKL